MLLKCQTCEHQLRSMENINVCCGCGKEVCPLCSDLYDSMEYPEFADKTRKDGTLLLCDKCKPF